MFRKCHHSARCNRSRGRSLKKQRKATDIDHVGDSQTTATTAMHWQYPRPTNSGVCEGFFRGPFIKMNRFLYISLLVGGGCPPCKKNHQKCQSNQPTNQTSERANKQTNKQRNKETNKQTNKQTYKQTNKHSNKRTNEISKNKTNPKKNKSKGKHSVTYMYNKTKTQIIRH